VGEKVKPKLKPILPVVHYGKMRSGLAPVLVRYKLPGAKFFFTVQIGWDR
jgi:hypothetical protein